MNVPSGAGLIGMPRRLPTKYGTGPAGAPCGAPVAGGAPPARCCAATVPIASPVASATATVVIVPRRVMSVSRLQGGDDNGVPANQPHSAQPSRLRRRRAPDLADAVRRKSPRAKARGLSFMRQRPAYLVT